MTVGHLHAQGWAEIPNTKIRPVCWNGALNTQCQNVIAAWNSAVMDTQRNRMIIWGGGHNDYYGNEVYAINLTGTPSAERLTSPTAGGCSLYSCDGGLTPNSRHTYDQIEYIPGIDKMFVFGGASAGNGYGLGDTWLFNFATKTWEYKTPTLAGGVTPPALGGGGTTGYDPNTGKVFLYNLSRIWSYTPSTNTYVNLGSGGPFVGYWATGVIDPVRKRFYQIGGGDMKYSDISGNGSYDAVTQPTTGCATLINQGYPGVIFNPTTDRIEAWTGTDTIYSFNTVTGVCTSTVVTNGPPNGFASCCMFNRWNYSPALGAVVVVTHIDQNAYTFRSTGGTPPPAGDTQAPTVPTSLTAVPASSSQVNLSWMASSDNVGVTGYQVQRCSGTGCTNFANVTTATTLSYSDTVLTASTSYSYRVRAADSAGNFSGYSTVVTATTPAVPPPVSTTRTVGPGKQYASVCAAIAAANAGDTLDIDPVTYTNESCVIAKNNLLIRGVNGRAHLRWTGGFIPNGKGIFVIQGSDIVIERLEFSGAKVADDNGAGIRYEGGNLTIRDSFFHDNQNGLLGQGGLTHTLLIERSEFSRNGYCGGGGCAHNLYVGNMGRLIFRFNTSVDSLDGSHPLKSRARVNEITGNSLSTRNTDGSLEADFPNGGTLYFTGNTVEQGVNTGNSSVIAWGAEGASNPNPRVYISNNTFVNRRTTGATFVQLSGPPTTLMIKGNTFIGPGTVLTGTTTDLSSNTIAP